MKHFLNTTGFSNTQNETSLPESTWELLHWIFTNPLNIKVIKESELSEYFTDELREVTKLMTIPYPSNRCLGFKITHDIISTSKFHVPFSRSKLIKINFFRRISETED